MSSRTIFDGAKPITSPIVNNWQLVCILVASWDRRVTMDPFYRQMRRRNISLSEIINQRDKTGLRNVLCTVKRFISQSFYLSSAPSCICSSSPSYSPVCQPFFLSAEHISSPPSCLNSLWTPNANSVRHLIRHINSISPLIALIPLCNEFLCGIPSVQ